VLDDNLARYLGRLLDDLQIDLQIDKVEDGAGAIQPFARTHRDGGLRDAKQAARSIKPRPE
jgi:hypothetical protein